jgi:hypothetical protein
MASSETPLLSSTSSDKQRMLGALLAAFRENELTSDQLIPATVVSFDRTNNVATLQPLIQWVDVNDGTHSRPPLVGLNVLSLGGGGFHINFPLVQGDLGWIIAADRDLSLFKQSLEISTPNTGRLHTFEDGWFIPDVFRQYTINGADTNAMVIQSTDGATRISISAGIVNITAPTGVKVDTPTATFTGNVIVQQSLTVNQNAEVKQNLTVDVGAALPSGSTVGGINVSTHGHTSNSPGNRTIGNMLP